MLSLKEALKPILIQPTCAGLVALQGAMLASGGPAALVESALEVAGEFHAYLGELQSKLTAKEFSELASRLDMGAVGAVALENLAATEREDLWQRLLMGGLGEALMVAASRQYIKAWQAETGLVHSRAAWYLAGALWRISVEVQPGLEAGARWQAIHSLLAPAHDTGVPGPAKAVLLSQVFQTLLLARTSYLLSFLEARP